MHVRFLLLITDDGLVRGRHAIRHALLQPLGNRREEDDHLRARNNVDEEIHVVLTNASRRRRRRRDEVSLVWPVHASIREANIVVDDRRYSIVHVEVAQRLSD